MIISGGRNYDRPLTLKNLEMISPGLHSNFKASQFLSSRQAIWASNTGKATRNLHPSALRGLSVRQAGSETVHLWDQRNTQIAKKVETGTPGSQGTPWKFAVSWFSCFFKQIICIRNDILKKIFILWCENVPLQIIIMTQLVSWVTSPWTAPCYWRVSTCRGGNTELSTTEEQELQGSWSRL